MKQFFRKLIVYILTLEARAVIRKYHPSVVAVTGSVGKTSTKDAVYAVLSEYAHARKSEKSFNSEIGVPLTILGRPNAWNNPLRWIENIFDGLLLMLFTTVYPEWLVLEVGADHPGDIRRVVRWLPLDIAIITRLPEVPVHVEFFDSPQEVIEEKAALIMGLKPSGTLVLNADDERVMALRERAQGRTVLTYGSSGEAAVRCDEPEIVYGDSGQPIGMKALIQYRGSEKVPLSLMGTLGAHVFQPPLAALAVAAALDMKLQDAVSAIERNYTAPPGRMHLVEGMRDSFIIDDSYNSSPAAAEAALAALAAVEAKGRKYAVLGDMMELGRFSIEEHRKLGALAAKSADVLMTVGLRARDCAQAALDAGMADGNILQFEDVEDAGAALAGHLGQGDVALIKGSQSVRLERAVKMVMAEPARAKELLVRQEDEWLRR